MEKSFAAKGEDTIEGGPSMLDERRRLLSRVPGEGEDTEAAGDEPLAEQIRQHLLELETEQP